jgi:hypothetical protein
MTEWYPDEELRELANLPRDAAARKAMEARLGAVEPVEREYWIGYLRLTDRLNAELSRVETPAGLEERLLRVAEQPPPAMSWGRVIRKSLNWKSIAACVLLLLASKNLWDWYSSLPAGAKPLENNLAVTISREAVRELEAHPAMDVIGGDAGAVRDAIASRGAPFAMVLHPRGKADLLGGGVVDFHGTPAAYTRWQAGGAHYTVYQFDGTKLGVPGNFAVARQTPTELWHGNERFKVVIWPGKLGSCTWAAVMDSDGAEDLFSGVSY